MTQAVYADQETRQVGEFVAALRENSNTKSGTFDSAAAGDMLASAKHGRGVKAPEQLESILSSIETGDSDKDSATRERLATAILDGVSFYEKEHGVAPTADVLRSAIHQGWSTTPDAVRVAKSKGFTTYDTASATSDHHDQLSVVAGRANIAIMMAIAEAVPFAGYLPAAVESNESRLVIVGHHAGSDWGSYRKGNMLDGELNGKPYIDSSRTIKLTETSGTYTGQITSMLNPDNPEESVTIANGATVVQLLRGRSQLYVSGLPVGRESSNTSATNSPIIGEVTLKGVTYTISGSVKPDTGEFTATSSPALPANTSVHAQGYVDYEKQPGLAPKFTTESKTYKIYANAWRAIADQTIDSSTQFQNELGLDIGSEAMLSLRTQFANERHYSCLDMAGRLQEINNQTWEFDSANQFQTKSYGDIFRDFTPTLEVVDQEMAHATMDHASNFMYVGRKLAAIIRGLPSDVFQSSGITHRPGIYRMGTLFGKACYFNPRAVESGTSSRMLLIGRSAQVARNPFILGDAVAPMAITFGNTPDFSRGTGYYARMFTEVNPHAESAMGVGSIDITNLPV